MVKEKLKRLTPYKCVIEQEGDMNVPAFFYLNETLEGVVEDKTLQQTMNMATLPGVKMASMAMPDAHMGYGFPVGGVAAIDADDGVISPGGIGFDINCGIRVLSTDLTKEDVRGAEEELLQQIFDNVPPGVGRSGELRLNREELDQVLENGPEFLVENGIGREEDLRYCESHGYMSRANADAVSQRAKSRGRKQIGTIGGGNHFIEIQFVDSVLDKVASTYGLEEGQVVIMIHTGSRGLGHQVCSDYLRRMEDAFPEIIESLPEKDLAYAPLDSDLANEYIQAMCASAHFAWANRHFIGHQIRESFDHVLGDVSINTLYDIAHNIAKRETHVIDDEEQEVYVHRKGATRAFPPGHAAVPEAYRDVGQPVLIPGSMGTSSYILKGLRYSMDESFGSACHGAGRIMSRTEAKQRYGAEGVKRELAGQSIFVKSASQEGVSEEAPGAYKDVDDVIDVVADAQLAAPVARLRPMGVVKG